MYFGPLQIPGKILARKKFLMVSRWDVTSNIMYISICSMFDEFGSGRKFGRFEGVKGGGWLVSQCCPVLACAQYNSTY